MHFIHQFALQSSRILKEALLKSMKGKTFCILSKGITTPPGEFIDLDGFKIHYEKLGHGDHVVLFMAGAVGSTRIDFGPLEKMDLDKFTVLAWDPPGYGFSRPPKRTFPNNFLHRDAELARKLVEAFNISKLSVVGWCNGANTAIIFAAKYPNLMKTLIAYAAASILTESDAKWLRDHRDVTTWPVPARTECVEIYGEKGYQETWRECLDAMLTIYEKEKGDISMSEAKMITCPTLLLAGSHDRMLSVKHLKILGNTIKSSQTLEIEGATHFFPVENPDAFYNIVQTYLLKNKVLLTTNK